MQPGLNAPAPAREQTVALLLVELADAAGYEKRFGAEALRGKVQQLREVLELYAEKNSGNVLRPTQGPLVASFSTVWNAARVAVTIQRKMRDQNIALPEKAQAYAAMAIHQGNIQVADGGDIRGDTWDLAMRILAEAIPEEILISDSALPSLTTEFSWFAVKEIPIDGKAPMPLQDIVWREDGKSVRVQKRSGATVGLTLLVLLGVMMVGTFLWTRLTASAPTGIDETSNLPVMPVPVPVLAPLIPAGPSLPDTVPPATSKPEKTAPPKEARAPKEIKGTLTLVTIPAAKAMFGNKLLGTTPLFDIPLPVGHHVLTVQGDDGRRRKLSVPIEAGKRTSIKLRLEDVPIGR